MKNNAKGFTLIEVLIYIALFSMLMGSAFIASYQLIDGSDKLAGKNIIQAEGNFVMRKINWVLTGVDTSHSITPSSGTSSTLSLTRYDGNQVSIKLNGTQIEFKDSNNGSTFLPITTTNVSVDSLQFEYLNSDPAGITATFTIDGSTFSITKYFR